MSKAKTSSKSASSASAQAKSQAGSAKSVKAAESCCAPGFSAVSPQSFFESANSFFPAFQKQTSDFFSNAMKAFSSSDPFSAFGSCGIPSFSDFQAAYRSFGFPFPGVDLREDDSCFTIAARVPDVRPENVDVSVSDHYVTISCSGQSSESRKDKDSSQNIFSARSFYKTIALPDVANTSKAEADFKNGVLTITVPKRKESAEKAKRIPISKKSA